jgi:YVTN family beta-propeller protein
MDVAINSKTDKIYVVNFYSNSVSIIDGKTNTVVGNTTIDAFPKKAVVSPDTDRIYLDTRNKGNSTLVAIDGYTNKIVNKLKIGEYTNDMAVGPFDITTSPGSNNVTIIDGPTLSTYNYIPPLPVGNTSDTLRGIAVDTTKNQIYVVDAGSLNSNLSHVNVAVIQGPNGLNDNETAHRISTCGNLRARIEITP